MPNPANVNRGRERTWAALLALGACILIFRTVAMMVGGAFGVLVGWVAALLVAEFLIDVATLVASLRWLRNGVHGHSHLALRLGAAAAILHAVRVAIFVLGRTGPWMNFDVRPEQRALHPERWNWGQVWFAAVLSVLGVLGVLLIWWLRTNRKENPWRRSTNA